MGTEGEELSLLRKAAGSFSLIAGSDVICAAGFPHLISISTHFHFISLCLETIVGVQASLLSFSTWYMAQDDGICLFTKNQSFYPSHPPCPRKLCQIQLLIVRIKATITLQLLFKPAGLVGLPGNCSLNQRGTGWVLWDGAAPWTTVFRDVPPSCDPVPMGCGRVAPGRARGGGEPRKESDGGRKYQGLSKSWVLP